MGSRWTVDRSRLAWWAVGSVLFAVLAFVVHSFVGTFVFGVFIYYATRPVYRRIANRMRPPSLAAAFALLLLALPALLLLAYTLAIGLQEVNRLLERVQFASLEAILGPYIDVSSVARDPQELLNEPSARAALQTFLDEALRYLGFIGNAALHLFVMISIAFYLLRDDRRLARWFGRRFGDGDGVVEAYGRAVDRDFRNIFFGNILNAVLTGVIGAISYNLLDYVAPAGAGIPYPTLIGLLAGIASLVPVVGMKVVYFPVAIYLSVVAAQASPRLLWFPAAFAVVSFVIVDTIPDFVLRPYVSGRGLHVGMVMFAYIFGPLLFGWYGIFLGPMLLVLVVHFVRLVLPELMAGSPIEPAAVGASDAEEATETEAAASEGADRTDAGATAEDAPPDPDAGADPEPPIEENGDEYDDDPGTGGPGPAGTDA